MLTESLVLAVMGGVVGLGLGWAGVRAIALLQPVGIDGAYDAWPRSALLPWLTPIHVRIGEPLGPEQVRQLDDEQLVRTVQQRMQNCHRTARHRRLQ